LRGTGKSRAFFKGILKPTFLVAFRYSFPGPSTSRWPVKMMNRNFICPTDGMLWTYEKDGTIKFQSGVKNTGHETNYYLPEVEKYLANNIENPANNVIEKIRCKKEVTIHDKKTLATYMVVMLKRVPQSKIRLKEMAPGVAQQQQEKWDQEISKLINLYANTVCQEYYP